MVYVELYNLDILEACRRCYKKMYILFHATTVVSERDFQIYWGGGGGGAIANCCYFVTVVNCLQIKHIEKELVSVKEENAHITKENKSLNRTISELKIAVIKLESTKSQLEFDQCNLKAALDKMDHDYHQVNDSF